MGSFKHGLALASATLLLWGCGTFPLPKVYILGDPARSAPGVIDETGLPHLELKTVTVPDYLDTTDILRRSASNEVVTSPAGRWGERVSLGITHALAIDLAARLPNIVIESRGAYEPARRLLVDVERFEIGADGRCTLTARWRITTADSKVAANSEQGSFIVAATATSDAAVTLAMTSAIDQLAARIAVTVSRAASDVSAAARPSA
jgi:uncharacterized lipoprotein YmbA